MAESPWIVEFTDWDPAEEGRIEALSTLGNGVFATRGADTESTADGIHYPGTYAAGVYNRLVSEVAGRQLEHESLVNLPNWLPLTFRVGEGPWLGSAGWQVLERRKTLDLRAGMLTRAFRVRDPEGRVISVAERRMVDMAEPHLAAVEWTITPEGWSGLLWVRSTLDAEVENRNVAAHRELAGRHLRLLDAGEAAPGVCWLEVETTQSHVRVAQAVRTRVLVQGRPIQVSSLVQRSGARIHQDMEVEVTSDQETVVEKVVALYTGRDHAISEPRAAALELIEHAEGFDRLLEAHRMAWRHLWWGCGLSLGDGEADSARILHLHIFHVLQTLSPHVADRDFGVPARGLHGEGYRGHIFWDELFVFPFLNLRMPDLTRALLLYRYRRLPAARRLARRAGRAGAMYPWQSGSDGREETPVQLYNPLSQRWMADNSRRQRHVGLAVAYNVWHYYQVTADTAFLAAYGAEMLIEIARLFADLAAYDPGDGRYHIAGVMGPDEFHDGYPDRPGEGIDDNAYTNILVSWLLRRCVDTYRLLAHHHCGELRERLGLDDDEVASWERMSRGLAVPFLDDGIIAQFAGYERLDELDWEDYRRRYGNIGRLDLILEAEGDTPNRYQASKQADVLMLFYLFSADELTDLLTHLGYPFDPASIPPTIDYYTARTSNGSTLSRVVHAWVLSRADRERSWHTFTEALAADIADTQGGTTREGIHLGAMAGTVDLVQRCYLGVETRDDVLWFNPRLPVQLDHLRLSLRYRGHWFDVHATEHTLRVSSRPCAAAPVRVGLVDRVVELTPGERAVIDLTPG